MILVDTSIWVDHLRTSNTQLVGLLNSGKVLGHQWVTGEISLCNLSNRDEVLRLLGNLPQATVATPAEIATLIDVQRLDGLGIGYVDAQLIAATLLTPDASLWTKDKRLGSLAARLAIQATPPHR